MLKIMLSIALTVVCWGVYGPLLHWGQIAMQHSRLRPFVCVGIAYFLIAVLVPGIALYLKGERGAWTARGALWSLVAGALGALGSLGIIMAFAHGGRPLFVMPLVFGGAPVTNAFLTIFMSRSFKQVGPVFVAGLILVVTGAVSVLIFKPGAGGQADFSGLTIGAVSWVILWVAVVALSWGAYGPVLHKGQMKMSGSRLRPLICVGLAYFAVAVFAPLVLLGAAGEQGAWTTSGTFWSIVAGAITATGALGIIMAFNFGGKPIYVMPLVFGGAPVVNTFFSMASGGADQPGPLFYAGLILVAVGAVVVLVFAPRKAEGGRRKAESQERKADRPVVG